MATYIKTLKEDNGDITYPQTTADAVLNTNSSSTQGGTVQAFLNKAVTAEEIAVVSEQTPMVTASMINWSTMQPTVTTQKTAASGWFAPTWYKREYPDGRIIYTCYSHSISLTFAGSQLIGNYLTSPVTFNSAKMSASVSVSCPDSAIVCSGSAISGDSNINVHVYNAYTGSVTNYLDINVRIEVFPN